MIFAAVVALLIAASMAAWHAYRNHSRLARTSQVLQILRSLPQNELIVRTEQQVSRSGYDDSTLLLGRRHGHASIIVRTHIAMNLELVKPSDIKVVGCHVTVKLPSVHVFEVTPDLASLEIYGRKSGLYFLMDPFRGRTLRDDIFSTVTQSLNAFRYEDVSGHRSEVVSRLNADSQRLFAGTGLIVTFK